MSKRAERLHGIVVLLAMAVFVMAATGGAAFAASSGQPARILVLPFQVAGVPEVQATAENFPEILGQRIATRGTGVIPNSTMLNLVRTRSVSTLDVRTVRALAAEARATHAVYGSLNQIGDSVSVDARLVSVNASESARPIYVEQQGGAGNLAGVADELASRVSAQFARKDSIADVEVRGTKVLDPDVVLMRINTRRGDMVDSAAIDREIKTIWDLGYFSDVRVEMEQRPEGMVLVYIVTEKPRIETVTVEGNTEVDTDDIVEALSSKHGSILNEKLLAEDIQKVMEIYRKKGFYLANVSHRIDSRQDGASAALILVVDEGKKLYISSVRVEGAEQMSEGSVKDEMLLTERNIISWITGTGVLKEELIERDSAAIAQFYLNNGFMDISVGAPKIDYTKDGIEVTFVINEGPRYTLGEVAFAGDLIDTDERLRTVIETDDLAASGKHFNYSVMQDDTKKLTDFYSDFGYAFADVSARPQKRPEGNIVDMNFVIEKKNKVYVRQVVVEGNAKTRDNVILREMRLADGDSFEGSKLRRSTERLNKLGYFEVAEAELVPTENEEEVDLKVKVKERPTGALMAGVGYSTFSQFGVSGTLMERNLWGKGYLLAFQAGFSGRRDAYTLTFLNPRWEDTPLSVGGDIYHWRDDYIDYVKRTTGGVLRFGYPLGEYTTVTWGYRLEQYKIYDLDDDAAKIIEDYADEVRYTSVGLLRIARDTTNRERPTNGNIDRIGVEYGGGILAGDDDFITLTAEHQTYYQLWPDHVLHGRVKGSAIFKNHGSDEVPVFERFWMGGMDSVRGYSSRDIVPRDPDTGDRIGGTRMAFANLEYIYSLSNEVGVNLVPFFDIGFNIDTDNDYEWSDEVLKSFGLELRWRSPMGDLRFSYGIPLDEDRKGDRDAGRFEFSMGQFF